MRNAYHNIDPFNQPTMAICEAKMNVWLREQEQLAADGSGSWPCQAGAKLRDLTLSSRSEDSQRLEEGM